MTDCWNTIGVHGDGSCPELRRHVHCRNCPVYADAAVELLDGDLPADYSEQWTSHYATPPQREDHDREAFLLFRLGTEWLGLRMVVVKEVAGLRPIHSLPHRRGGAVLGLANVRGELLVCVSLAHVLGVRGSASPEAQRTAHRRLLVLRHGDQRVVCPVDEVHGIHRIGAGELKELPATVARAATAYSKAVATWRDRSVGLLDEQLLFHSLQRSVA